MMPSDIAEWTKSSPQTCASDYILELTQEVRGDKISVEKIRAIFEILSRVKSWQSNVWLFIFLRRSGIQILGTSLETAFSTGCGDNATIFLSLARSCGVACRLIHAFNKEWLNHGSMRLVQAHFFAEYFDVEDDRWILVDPTQRQFLDRWSDDYVLHAVGKDAWDMGLKNYPAMFLQALQFRSKWRKGLS